MTVKKSVVKKKAVKKAVVKKAAVEETKPVAVELTTSPNILIELSITMPNGETKTHEATIVHAAGCISPAELNDSGSIFNGLVSGLVSRYGTGHVVINKLIR